MSGATPGADHGLARPAATGFLGETLAGLGLSGAGLTAALLAGRGDQAVWAVIAGAAALLLLAGILARRHRQGWLAPAPLFLAAGIAYLLPTMITVSVGGLLTDTRFVADQRLVLAGRVALGAWSVAALVIVLWRRPTARRGGGLIPLAFQDSEALGLSSAALLFIGVVGVGVFILQVGGLGAIVAAGYGERYQLMEGKGVFLVGLQSIGVAGVAGYALSLERRSAMTKLVVAGATAALLVWTLAVASRSAFVQMVLALLVVYQGARGRISNLVLIGLGGVVVGAGLLIGVTRAGIDVRGVDPGVIVAGVNPANAEFGAALPTISDVIELVPDQEPFRLGETFLGAVGLIVPRAIWPERPIGGGVWYVERFYPGFADLGGAYAFSPVAESYLNFGFPGVVIIFSLLGALIGWLDRWAARPDLSVRSLIPLAIALPWILLLPRMDLATLVKSFLVLTLGQVAALYLVARLLRSALDLARLGRVSTA